MRSLQGFSDAATPVFTDLGKAAPSLTDATRTLTPFTAASTVALKSLGASGEVAGPILREADPIVSKTAEVARSGVGPTTSLSSFFTSTRESGGFNGLVELIYNTTATLNGFDKYGHFGRTLITLSNCLDYEVSPPEWVQRQIHWHGGELIRREHFGVIPSIRKLSGACRRNQRLDALTKRVGCATARWQLGRLQL